MSNNHKTDEALIHSILGRVSQTSNPAAGTTAFVSMPAAGLTKHILDHIAVSQRNQMAAAFTATLTVRDASIAGTVLGQWEFVTAVNTADRFAAQLGIKGLQSSALFAVWDPPGASVTQKVTAVFYRESTSS